jgi:trans-aconitate 2-methyltransferase
MSWDAEIYDRVADPQAEWGRGVIDRLRLAGDERVLDAGCGSGRVTRLLVDRLPRGRVVAVDSSEPMIEKLRASLGDRVDAIVSDLVELTLDEPVDAVLSTATFHWISDHRRLFDRMHDALRPGGQLEAQCGGAGNIAAVEDAARRLSERPPFAASLGGWPGPWRFASPSEAKADLEASGFTEIECWLEPRPTSPAEPRDFIRVSCVPEHLQRLPAELHEPFIDALLAELPNPPVLEYVRLNISARRA